MQSTKNQSVGQLEPRSDHVPGRKGAALASNWLNSTGATFRLIVFILPLARREIEIEGKKNEEKEREIKRTVYGYVSGAAHPPAWMAGKLNGGHVDLHSVMKSAYHI